MHKFVRALITEWRRLELPVSGESIVVAVSGGADSVSLLLGLAELVTRKKLDIKIAAAHLNHGLRGIDSDADEAFVSKLTTKLGVDLVSTTIRISKSGNLEQNARETRYRFLADTAGNCGAFAVFTGHTMTDQAETFLMNLIRGSGPEGLSAMKSVRPLIADRPSISLVRPLLNWAERSDTETFCRDLDVKYRTDAMNNDLKFQRVRIRKHLLPLLAEMNPKIVATLARTAKLMPDAAESVSGTSSELAISMLKPLDDDTRRNVVREWLVAHRGTGRRLSMEHCEAVARLSISEKSGRIVELPGGQRVVRKGGRLTFFK